MVCHLELVGVSLPSIKTHQVAAHALPLRGGKSLKPLTNLAFGFHLIVPQRITLRSTDKYARIQRSNLGRTVVYTITLRKRPAESFTGTLSPRQ